MNKNVLMVVITCFISSCAMLAMDGEYTFTDLAKAIDENRRLQKSSKYCEIISLTDQFKNKKIILKVSPGEDLEKLQKEVQGKMPSLLQRFDSKIGIIWSRPEWTNPFYDKVGNVACQLAKNLSLDKDSDGFFERNMLRNMSELFLQFDNEYKRDRFLQLDDEFGKDFDDFKREKAKKDRQDRQRNNSQHKEETNRVEKKANDEDPKKSSFALPIKWIVIAGLGATGIGLIVAGARYVRKKIKNNNRY
jgi:hypothetical protein